MSFDKLRVGDVRVVRVDDPVAVEVGLRRAVEPLGRRLAFVVAVPLGSGCEATRETEL